MPTNITPVAAGLQAWGVGKETTFGTAVTASAYPKLTKFAVSEKLGTARDESIRNDMADVHGEQATTVYYQIDIEGGAAPDDLGWILANLYGAVNVVGASAPYAHTFSLLNTTPGQPVSHTWTYQNGAVIRQYAGCRVQSVNFKYNAGALIGYSATMLALTDTAAGTLTPSFTTIVPMAAWNTTVSLGGSASALVTDCEITIERSLKPVFSLQGVQTASAIFAGSDFKSSGKATLVYNSDTIYTNNFKAGVPLAVVIDSTTGATTTLVELKHTSTQAFIETADIGPGSDGYMELALSWNAISNTTDTGPVTSLLKNATAGGIYL